METPMSPLGVQTLAASAVFASDTKTLRLLPAAVPRHSKPARRIRPARGEVGVGDFGHLPQPRSAHVPVESASHCAASARAVRGPFTLT